MPMPKHSRSEPLTRLQFHEALRNWLTLNEDRVGPENDYGGSAWVHVKDAGELYRLNGDTQQDAVEAYLQTVALHGEDLAWTLVENQRGNLNAVAYGPEQKRITSFYLYWVEDA